ncbi:uncharacterized protein LOC111260506 [Varroa jacobsoni]|uniref:Uncharacterized protein n=1 Tax=Varroa destructor TaxID=109461 RepID=A0A7M7JT20_VARDE|nr:uncharacterized protein LOC111248404 [Varroa destructor]XP_022689060.1 uncharacterized protein LOC111260506 [Varroa jacobsoni]
MTSFGPYCVNTDAILSQPSVGAVTAGGATRCLCAHPAPASQPPITAYASRYFLQSDRDRSIYHNHKHGHQCLCYHSVYNRNRRQGAIHENCCESGEVRARAIRFRGTTDTSGGSPVHDRTNSRDPRSCPLHHRERSASRERAMPADNDS